MILIAVLLISFLASLVRSSFGFGEALVAVPLLLFFLPAEVAVPLTVMLSVVIALVIVIQDHRKIHFESAKWLILYALLGLPLGIYILLYADEKVVKIVLAALILLYSLYCLFSKTSRVLLKESKWGLFVCGFLSGVLGGAYGLNGPPLVIYGNLRRWSPTHFRATLQAYFLPVSLLSVLGFYYKGLLTPEVNSYFLYCLISSIPAIFLGRYINRKLKDGFFFKFVYYGLMVISLILLATTLA
ncbi:sulfite exporter TauE/SafE family protein [Chryseobacterium sp. A321]